MSLSIGKILDPAGIFRSEKPNKTQNNVTINNYYGNQGPQSHHPPHHGQCQQNQQGMNPQKMMAMFGMLMQMCQMMSQGQGQDQNNGSFASAQASNGNSFAFAQAGTFNMVS